MKHSQLKPHNHVILNLTFQRKLFWIFSINIKRKIGFVFNNYVSHMVYIASEAKNAKEFSEWTKIENGALFNFEMLYCAAVHYREILRKPDNFTRTGLKRALMTADKDQVKLLTDCIKRTEHYGATYKKKSNGEEAEQLTPNQEYEFCIGKVGIPVDQYWQLTQAETFTIVQGWLWRDERRTADFRELYTLQFNQWSKTKKTSTQLWPLKLIDKRFSQFETAEEEYKDRAEKIEWAKKTFGL